MTNYININDIHAGDIIQIDGGFTCCKKGMRVVYKDTDGLYFRCSEGRHYLDGQIENDDDYCIGVTAVYKKVE